MAQSWCTNPALFKNITQLCAIQKHYSALQYSKTLLNSTLFRNISQLCAIASTLCCSKTLLNSALLKNITQLCAIASTLRYSKIQKHYGREVPAVIFLYLCFLATLGCSFCIFLEKKRGKKEKNIPVDNGMQS